MEITGIENISLQLEAGTDNKVKVRLTFIKPVEHKGMILHGFCYEADLFSDVLLLLARHYRTILESVPDTLILVAKTMPMPMPMPMPSPVPPVVNIELPQDVIDRFGATGLKSKKLIKMFYDAREEGCTRKQLHEQFNKQEHHSVDVAVSSYRKRGFVSTVCPGHYRINPPIV